MDEIPLNKATGLIYPRLTVLVTTVNSAEEANAAPYSWIAPVSFRPPMLYLGIQKRETLTIKNMRRTKEFVVNVVSRDWAGKAIACEAKIPDKVEKSGLEFRESKKVRPPTAASAKIALECRLKDVIKTGDADHFIVIGEIVHAEKDPALKDEDLVMHDTGPYFVSLGKKYQVERKK